MFNGTNTRVVMNGVDMQNGFHYKQSRIYLICSSRIHFRFLPNCPVPHKKMTVQQFVFCMLSTLYSNYSLHLNHLNLIRGVGRINFIVGVTFFPQKNQYDDLHPYFDTVIEGQISTQKKIVNWSSNRKFFLHNSVNFYYSE